MTKALKLTDTQLMLLSAASQRDDHLLILPETLTGKAATAAIAKIISSNLVEEVVVGQDAPHCHQDDEGQPIGLQLTRAGLEAIGVDEETASEGQGRSSDAADPVLSGSPGAADPAEKSTSSHDAHARRPAPREGTKRALVVVLLSRDQGASIGELTASTGWLPHTTRAALTGLRQSGYAITRTRDGDNHVAYRITPDTPRARATASVDPAGNEEV